MYKNYLKPVMLFGLGLALLSASGCATIFGKSSYPITLNTDPQNADIVVTNKKGVEIFKGASPATVQLKSSSGYLAKAEYQVKIHKNGYTDRIVPIHFKLNGWYFGNLLIGGLVGMLIVDPASGAMFKIETDSFNEKLQSTATSAAPSLNIIDYNSLSEVQKKNLKRIN